MLLGCWRIVAEENESPFTPSVRFSDPFFNFFVCFILLLIIVQFLSNLRSWNVSVASTLWGENRTNLSLVQLILNLFLYTSKIFHQQTTKMWCALLKNRIFVKNFWVLGFKKIQTHSNSRGWTLLAL